MLSFQGEWFRGKHIWTSSLSNYLKDPWALSMDNFLIISFVQHSWQYFTTIFASRQIKWYSKCSLLLMNLVLSFFSNKTHEPKKKHGWVSIKKFAKQLNSFILDNPNVTKHSVLLEKFSWIEIPKNCTFHLPAFLSDPLSHNNRHRRRK